MVVICTLTTSLMNDCHVIITDHYVFVVDSHKESQKHSAMKRLKLEVGYMNRIYFLFIMALLLVTVAAATKPPPSVAYFAMAPTVILMPISRHRHVIFV